MRGKAILIIIMIVQTHLLSYVGGERQFMQVRRKNVEIIAAGINIVGPARKYAMDGRGLAGDVDSLM